MKTRVFLLLLGAVLVLWGAGLPMVLWLGAEAPGTVTQVRRQLGDRGEAIPNRYTYTIAYEFRLPNGQMAQGHTQRVGDFFCPTRHGGGQASARALSAWRTLAERDSGGSLGGWPGARHRDRGGCGTGGAGLPATQDHARPRPSITPSWMSLVGSTSR
jgi:hypothetical protein